MLEEVRLALQVFMRLTVRIALSKTTKPRRSGVLKRVPSCFGVSFS
jgi:hypothetical protein